MEKQARIVVKPKEVSQEEKQRKAALLAQYANVTDEEEYPFPDPVKIQCFEGQYLLKISQNAFPAWQCLVGRLGETFQSFQKHGRS